MDSQFEDSDLMVREAFHILTQGVETTHYEVKHGIRKTYSIATKILWLNPDSLRLCVTKTRPSVMQGKVYPGLYLRDVAEVIGGAHTYEFASQPEPPSSHEQCLNIISSERTLCLQLPSEFSRNWFLERLKLLCYDILTSNEKNLRESIKWTSMSNRMAIKEAHHEIACATQELLERGIPVLYHTSSGSVMDCKFTYNAGDRRLELHKKEGSIFSFSTLKKGLNIVDIYSLRPGTHSYGFVKAKEQDEKQEHCLSIIGSECTMDIELASQRARDVLMHKLKVFSDFLYVSLQEV